MVFITFYYTFSCAIHKIMILVDNNHKSVICEIFNLDS